MTTLEHEVRAALHTAADDAAASVDLTDAWDRLDLRLERSDRTTRHRRWIVAAAAAAAVALVAGAITTLHDRSTSTPPVSPPTSMTPWTGGGATLGRPTFTIPSWAARVTPVTFADTLVSWSQDSCRTACPVGADRKLVLLVPQAVGDPSTGLTRGMIAQPSSVYAAWIDKLRGVPGVTVSHWTPLQTAQDLPASLVTITSTKDVDGVLGCPDFSSEIGNCRGLAAGTRTTLALFDAGHAPMLVWETERADADGAAQAAEVRAIASSLRLHGLPVSCTSVTPERSARTLCLPDLWLRIMADSWLDSGNARLTQGQVNQVWSGYATQLGDTGGYPGPWSFGVGPHYDESSELDWTAKWTFSGVSTTGYMCMAGAHVVILTTPC